MIVVEPTITRWHTLSGFRECLLGIVKRGHGTCPVENTHRHNISKKGGFSGSRRSIYSENAFFSTQFAAGKIYGSLLKHDQRRTFWSRPFCAWQ